MLLLLCRQLLLLLLCGSVAARLRLLLLLHHRLHLCCVVRLLLRLQRLVCEGLPLQPLEQERVHCAQLCRELSLRGWVKTTKGGV